MKGKKQKEPVGMNPSEIFAALAMLEKERGIPQTFMMEKIIQAITTAYKRDHEGVENVIISLGKEGAVLASAEGLFHAIPPKICAISTVGAGDSSIAGFLAALLEGKSKAEALRMAVACGTAACLQNGTRPPRAEDVARILSAVEIKCLG